MSQEMAAMLTERIVESVRHYENFKIPIGVSNRHVHVSRADLDILYGKDYALTHKGELGQPGQFAANETVTLKGPKGTFEHVRILGPVRSQSQVEISKTDSFRLGVKAPITLPGHLQGTPGITLVGPRGTVELPCGVIIAKRHIHMTPAQATARHCKMARSSMSRPLANARASWATSSSACRIRPAWKCTSTSMKPMLVL